MIGIAMVDSAPCNVLLTEALRLMIEPDCRWVATKHEFDLSPSLEAHGDQQPRGSEPYAAPDS